MRSRYGRERCGKMRKREATSSERSGTMQNESPVETTCAESSGSRSSGERPNAAARALRSSVEFQIGGDFERAERHDAERKSSGDDLRGEFGIEIVRREAQRCGESVAVFGGV